MATVVITGGIGSGKSLLCGFLAQKGLPVYDSDGAAKALYDKDPVLSAEVGRLFGGEVMTAEGKIDRKALAKRVFGDPEALARLEALVHPAVFRDFGEWKSEHNCGRVG